MNTEQVVSGARSNVDVWSGEAFLAERDAWVAAEAARRGIELTGEREQRQLRPWSGATRFAAVGGDLWFKVNAVGTRFEGTLVGLLAELQPGLVPDVLAVDPERGWSLTRDAGPVMREAAPPGELWDAWTGVVARYAEAQVRIAEHPGPVLATGVRVHTPATLPVLFRDLVAELGATSPDEGGLTPGERAALEATYDAYDAWCAELAGSGVPDSLQHDDLHSSNVCWTGGPIATARIIDWGDAIWSFPLITMLGTVNSIAWHAGCDRDDPRILRVRDAYLEPFTQFAAKGDLVRYVGLGRRVGCVTKALSYRTSLLGEPVATHAAEDFPVRGWLLELLEE